MDIFHLLRYFFVQIYLKCEIAKIVWQSCNFHENINKLQKRNKNQQETSSKILGDYKFLLLNNFEKKLNNFQILEFCKLLRLKKQARVAQLVACQFANPGLRV